MSSHKWVWFVAAGVLVVGLGGWGLHLVAQTIGLRAAFRLLATILQELAAALGPWGPLLLILALAVHSVAFMFPMEIPTLAAFGLYGPVDGLAIVWTGSMLAATISYFLGKILGPPVLKRWANNPRILALTNTIEHLNPVALILLRWISFIPFDVLNMMFGAFNLPVGRFMWTTAVGVLATNVVMALVYRSAVHAHWMELVTLVVVVAGLGWFVWWRAHRSGVLAWRSHDKDHYTPY
jgi:uncharacterized membrane protein YdjX (TVP38/TMEM64 family)